MEQVVKAILEDAKIREESFDKEASQSAVDFGGALVDHNKFYKITLYEACDQAAGNAGFGTDGTQLVYLLLHNSWNRILDWATDCLKGLKND